MWGITLGITLGNLLGIALRKLEKTIKQGNNKKLKIRRTFK